MPPIPDYIIIKSALNFQRGMYCVAAFVTLIGFGAFMAQESMTGVLALLIAAGVAFVASKIKTRKYYQGGGAVYR